MKRLFAAIKVHPSEVFLSQYYSIKKKLEREKIKWVEPENIHITLKFFGETPDHHIPAILAALKQAADSIPAFDLEIANAGIFGSSYKPRVIWFDVKDSGEVLSLTDKVLSELEKIGLERSRQNTVPHLTVGRIRSLNDKKYFQQVIEQYKDGHIQKEEVKLFHLFESILRPQGPEYHVVESFELMK